MSKFNIGTFTVLPLVLGVAMASDALAQRQISGQLEEVIVTAEKREQNLQDVALSVSALDEAGLEKMFARDLSDLAGMAPNMIIDPILGNGTAAISIRGMQLNDVEKSFDPAVAVYQDGIYLATTTGALLNTWDAARVEVLRGPQGTLFGRNTIGGLIHVIRNKPTGE
jgi:iron complex outermembrane receptor protein